MEKDLRNTLFFVSGILFSLAVFAQGHSVTRQVENYADKNCLTTIEPEDAALLGELDSVSRQAAAGQLPLKQADDLHASALKQSSVLTKPNGGTVDNPQRRATLASFSALKNELALKRALQDTAFTLSVGKTVSPERLNYLKAVAAQLGLADTPEKSFALLMNEIKASIPAIHTYRSALISAGVSYAADGTPDLSGLDLSKLRNDAKLRNAFVTEFPDTADKIGQILDPERTAPIFTADTVFLGPAFFKGRYPTLTPSEYTDQVTSSIQAYAQAQGFRVFNSRQGGGFTGLGTEVVSTFGGAQSAGDYYRQAQQTDSNTSARIFTSLSRQLGLGDTNPELLKTLHELDKMAATRSSAGLDAVQSSLRKQAAGVVAAAAFAPIAGAAAIASSAAAVTTGTSLAIAGAVTVGSSGLKAYQNGTGFGCELSREVNENGAVTLAAALAPAALGRVGAGLGRGAVSVGTKFAPAATAAVGNVATKAGAVSMAALRLQSVRALLLGGTGAIPAAIAKSSENRAQALEQQAIMQSAAGNAATARALQRQANDSRTASIATSTTAVVAYGAQAGRSLVAARQQSVANQAAADLAHEEGRDAQQASQNAAASKLAARSGTQRAPIAAATVPVLKPANQALAEIRDPQFRSQVTQALGSNLSDRERSLVATRLSRFDASNNVARTKLLQSQLSSQQSKLDAARKTYQSAKIATLKRLSSSGRPDADAVAAAIKVQKQSVDDAVDALEQTSHDLSELKTTRELAKQVADGKVEIVEVTTGRAINDSFGTDAKAVRPFFEDGVVYKVRAKNGLELARGYTSIGANLAPGKKAYAAGLGTGDVLVGPRSDQIKKLVETPEVKEILDSNALRAFRGSIKKSDPTTYAALTAPPAPDSPLYASYQKFRQKAESDYKDYFTRIADADKDALGSQKNGAFLVTAKTGNYNTRAMASTGNATPTNNHYKFYSRVRANDGDEFYLGGTAPVLDAEHGGIRASYAGTRVSGGGVGGETQYYYAKGSAIFSDYNASNAIRTVRGLESEGTLGTQLLNLQAKIRNAQSPSELQAMRATLQNLKQQNAAAGTSARDFRTLNYELDSRLKQVNAATEGLR